MTRTYFLQFCVNTLRSMLADTITRTTKASKNNVYTFECVVAVIMSMQAIDSDLELPTTFGSSRGVMKLNRYANIMPCKAYL